MKRICTCYLLFFVLCCLLATEHTCAQGWEWGKGNTGAFLDGWPIAADPYGNVFAAGMTEGLDYKPAVFGAYKVPFSIATLGNQCILVKYDSAGKFLWARGTQNGDTYLMGIASDKSGNAILFGTINSDSVEIGPIVLKNSISPAIQYFLAKFDSSGNVIWATSAGSGTGAPGPACTVFGTGAIATDDAGNIYITSNYQVPAITVGADTLTNACPNCQTDDILLAKYDKDGNVVWATSAGGSGNDEAYGLTVTGAGDIYISGVFTSPAVTFGPSTLTNATGGWNGYIARYDAAGKPVWASGSGGSGYELADFAVAVASDASDNVYLTGWVWDSSISYNGTTIINPYPHNLVAYLVKFDPSNEVSWYKTIGCPKGGNTLGYSVAVSPCAVWVSGAMNAPVNIDGNVLDTPAGSTDPIFIAGFNTAGAYIGSAALQSGGDDQDGIACDGSGNVYFCSDYEKTNTFTVGSTTLAHVETKTENLYVAKYIPVDMLRQDATYMHGDTAVCLASDQQINGQGGYSKYLWDNGSGEVTRPVNKEGAYEVMSMGGCSVIDSISVTNNNGLCGCIAGLPAAFTPNGDGKNDTYRPLFENGCTVNDYFFGIYNRWGQQVFHTTDPQARWDGTYWYINADIGAYQYYLQYKSGINNTQYHFSGDVTLIR